MTWKALALRALGAGLLAGCASVRTTPDIYRTERPEALTGIPCNLPLRQFNLKVTRTLTAGPDTTAPLAESKLEFDVTVAPSPCWWPESAMWSTTAGCTAW
jgi:hypothetical protein